MKICGYCGKENEDAASECVICHFTDFGTSQRTEPLAAAKAPTLRAEMREILSDWERAGDAHSTGVGLAVVAKGMERMGGEVGVQSHPGQGSCFWLEFPR
jgi:histidine kinase/DNA gyrase B/HSP90-like ATPase